MSVNTGCRVQVCCRFRPLSKKEKNNKNKKPSPIEYIDNRSIAIEAPGIKKRKYNFDRSFGPDSDQKDVYDYVGKPMIKELMSGYNCTIFSYGQTGSGKTFSMFGFDISSGETGVWKEEKGMGVIPRAIKDIFRYIQNDKDDIEYTIQVSFLEIYLEKVRDLLSPKHTNMKIRETNDGDIYVEGLKEVYVGSFEEILGLIRKGQKYRAVAETKMNQYSSRSHSVLQMKITQNNLTKETKTKSKLIMIDLAGSERVDKSGANGLTLTQVKHINKSLLMLGNVIHSITDKETHIPYRDSKLTRLLQDSLGGNSKTCLLVTCSPSLDNLSETLSTLNFGARSKKIKNKPRVNKEMTLADYRRIIDASNKKIKEYVEKERVLKAEISELLKNNNRSNLVVDTEIIEQLQKKINDLDNKIKNYKLRIQELNDIVLQQSEDIDIKTEEISCLSDNKESIEKDLYEKNQDIIKIKEKLRSEIQERKRLELDILEKNLRINQLEDKEYNKNNNDKKIDHDNKNIINQLIHDNDSLVLQYDKLKKMFNMKTEDIVRLQTEKEKVELELKEKQYSQKISKDMKDEIINDLKNQIKRMSDETMILKIDMEDIQQKYDQALKKIEHENKKTFGISSISSSLHENSQTRSFRDNIRKLKEYNRYIRRREKYYLTMISNRRQHIEALEEALKEATRIFIMREQDSITTINELKSDISRYCAILEEIGVPKDILGIGRDKIIIPLKNKSL